MPQEETTALLISKANEGKRVARLKGGDSFVFGRGGEEALALQAAGIPFELVPGVSSAIAVPEDFGIPVTHRGTSRSFTVVTGHTAADPNATEENYEALAKLEGTLVFLMGLSNLSQICGNLIDNGKPPETPASVLSKGFAADAVRYDGTLETISTVAKDAKTPAILVVGDVASFHLEQTPTTTPSISVIGTENFCRKFLAKCPSAVPFPLVDIRPVENSLAPFLPKGQEAFQDIEWLCFLSANAIHIFFERVGDVRKLAHLKFACVGAATADTLKEKGFVADFVPSRFDGETLQRELPGGGTADISTDYVVFASAGGVNAFFENNGRLNGAVPVCIGNPTAAALATYDTKGYIAPTATIDGILEEVRRLEETRRGQTGENS